MSKPPPMFTPALASEYSSIFARLNPDPKKLDEIDGLCARIMAHQDRYESVAHRAVNVPWIFIALAHLLECGLNFEQHLHNGDSLKRRTVNEPAGRPLSSPPWTWEESALDALRYDRIHLWTVWSVAGLLYKLEAYNGYGYRMYHPEVLTPYLVGGSQLAAPGRFDEASAQYTRILPGKYVSDGKWSATAVTAQIGAATVLKRLTTTGQFAFKALASGGSVA